MLGYGGGSPTTTLALGVKAEPGRRNKDVVSNTLAQDAESCCEMRINAHNSLRSTWRGLAPGVVAISHGGSD